MILKSAKILSGEVFASISKRGYSTSAKVLETHGGKVSTQHRDHNALYCPICGSGISDEKCPTCAKCGWSKCNGV